jgi:hypothetical protein
MYKTEPDATREKKKNKMPWKLQNIDKLEEKSQFSCSTFLRDIGHLNVLLGGLFDFGCRRDSSSSSRRLDVRWCFVPPGPSPERRINLAHPRSESLVR